MAFCAELFLLDEKHRFAHDLNLYAANYIFLAWAGYRLRREDAWEQHPSPNQERCGFTSPNYFSSDEIGNQIVKELPSPGVLSNSKRP
mgnify:CR=1|jgi:hypothetical protein